MYCAPATYYNNKDDLSTTTSASLKLSVHVLDRVANMEAILFAFIAEHSLSYSLSETLIELVQKLSKNEAALKRLHRNRATAHTNWHMDCSDLTWQNELTNICMKLHSC